MDAKKGLVQASKERCDKNTHETRIVKDVVDKKNLAPIKAWFVGCVNKMHRRSGSCWVECSDPIDLMDGPSNMVIGLCRYQKGQRHVNSRSSYSFDGNFI